MRFTTAIMVLPFLIVATGVSARDTSSTPTVRGQMTVVCMPSNEVEYRIEGKKLLGTDSECENNGSVGDIVGFNKTYLKDNYSVTMSIEGHTLSAQSVKFFYVPKQGQIIMATTYGGDISQLNVISPDTVRFTQSGRGYASKTAEGISTWECSYEIDFIALTISGTLKNTSDSDIPKTVCVGSLKPLTLEP